MKSRPPSIAVVDDDPALLQSISNLLESARCEVRTFPSADMLLQEGFEAFDCLITDIGMPGINGLELSEIAGRTRPGLPVFLITGRHEFVENGLPDCPNIAGLYRKPFDGPALLRAITNALGEF